MVMLRRTKAVVTASALATLALSGTAHATQGVHVDPNSPAGVEYALPLDSARNAGGGGSRSHHPAGGGAGTGSNTSGGSGASGATGGSALFGAGIRPAARAAAGAKPRARRAHVKRHR